MDSSRPLAIVTGASSGLGLTFADRLAARGHNLVLVARREDRLTVDAGRLHTKYGARATAFAADLTQPDSWTSLAEEIPTADLLVNCAGFATFGDFTKTEPQRLIDQIMLNCAALTALTRVYLPGMLERDRGAIINIASTAAFQPVPTMAVYAATKAYVASFTAALWDEVKGSQVRVVGICPGPTQTGFFTAGGDETVMPNRRNPDQVVATALAALETNQPLVVDGRANTALAALARVSPTQAQVRVARTAVKPGHPIEASASKLAR